MTVMCLSCGHALPADARFCPSCGTTVGQPAPPGRETRKVVTVLFADISGSTALGETLDPETVRSLLARHFAGARSVMERHGGTVEKFIGDAVMAVFGIPRAHEDDALRAVRAALELQASVHEINSDPLAPATIAIRVGINTGEVVTGDGRGDTLVTGDTVNIAARLEQAASPGDVFVGAATFDLVRDAVDAAALKPITARGKSEPIRAFNVVSLTGDEGRRRSERGQLVGRAAELAWLEAAFDRTRSGSAALVTVVAGAGVGKSRLIREFTARAKAMATVVQGRCLPYGDGITYWPIREVVHHLANVEEHHTPEEVRARVDDLAGGQPDIAETISAVVGLDSRPQRQEEVFWGIRRVLERTAADRPLVVVIEDLHWAEETLLELLEYLVAMAAQPVLIIGTARPELLDAQPAWGSTAMLLRLEPLSAATAEELLLAQEGSAAVSADVRQRILEVADGNPLFLEEMAAMLRDRSGSSTDREVTIPGTVQALLAARLDQLATEERAVLEHGAVIGRSFEAQAVAEIAPGVVSDRLSRWLLALVRREFLRPERAELTDGDAYRFRHILIRDAAYQAIAKRDRALLHERFAEWLEAVAGDRLGEYEEIIGHHLEQALLNRRELGESGLDALSQAAASWFLRAGLRALRRDDGAAAKTLLEKASTLGHDAYAIESTALRELVELYGGSGEFERAEESARRALEVAERAGDDRLAAIARIDLVSLHRHSESATWVAEAHRVVPHAIHVLEHEGDRLGVSLGWLVLALAAYPDFVKGAEYADKAYEHALAAGDPRQLGWAMTAVSGSAIGGEEPVAEALPKLQRLAVEAESLGRLFASSIAMDLAVVESMAGLYDQALRRAEAARAVHRELGHAMELAESTTRLMYIHEFGGAIQRAEPALRETIEFLSAKGERDLGPYQTAHLARVVAIAGKYDEAQRLVEQARVDDADPIRELLCRTAISFVQAAGGGRDEAVQTAQTALALVPAHAPNRRATTLLDLGRVLSIVGRFAEAETALGEARQVANAKGNVGLRAVIDGQLSEVRSAAQRSSS